MLCTSRNYAIWMAHYRMAGGLKSMFLLMGGYLALIAAILGLAVYNTRPEDLPQTLRIVATLLLVAQGFGLVVFGAARIAGAIRLDLTSNMIESHRQMPISAARAMVSYLFGTTVHLLAILLLNMAVLALLEQAAGIPLGHFVLSQIVLIAFALFVWTFAALGAFVHRQAMPILILLFIFGGCSSGLLRNWGLLPAASFLVAPLLGETIFNLTGGGFVIFDPAYPVALTAQTAFGAIFFLVACRRYRGTYLTTFNVPLGVGLAAVWGLLSAASIRLWPEMLGRVLSEFTQPRLSEQVVAALAVAALLLILPAHALAAWECQHGLTAGRRLLALAGMVLGGALSLAAAPWTGWLWMLTLLVLAAHVVTLYAGFKRCAALAPMTAAVLMAASLFILWLVPVLLEVVRWYLLPENRFGLRVHNFSLLSVFSPIGLLLVAWGDAPDPALMWVGAVFQTGLAVALWRVAARHAPKAVLALVNDSPRESAPS